jgi:sialidase-1
MRSGALKTPRRRGGTETDPLLADGNNGSGVDYIEYSLDSNDSWMRYNDPIEPQTQGLHTIYYRAVDKAGNIEQTRTVQVEIEDTEPPELNVSADPVQLWPPNNKLVPVLIFGTAIDPGSGIQSIHIKVVDEYGECEPIIQDILPGEIVNGNWERTIQLMASRRGNDRDGRKYTIIVTAKDNLGNIATKEIDIIVPHDQGK